MIDRLPSVFLRVEGLAVAVGALVLYVHQDAPWWLLLVLVLAPDLAMLGYLANPRLGAVMYDIAHLEALPIALGVAAVLGGDETSLELALIWLLHIGADRALGYGLKYPTEFKDTHLQRV